MTNNKNKIFVMNETCTSQVTANFQKGETILTIGDNNGRVGIIVTGSAHISHIDTEGREIILEMLDIGDSFGEYLMMPVLSDLFYVIADEKCTVTFINFKNVVYNCDNHCANHAELVRALLLLSSKRAQSLSVHANILSQRTIRNKLLLYFEFQKSLYGSNDLELPISLSRLADYISVDRAAMMRELKKMNDENIIRSNNRRITLLQED